MNVRYGLIIALSSILLITVSFSYFQLHNRNSLHTTITDAIPAASPVIVSFNSGSDYSKLTDQVLSNSYLKQSEIGARMIYQRDVLKNLLQFGLRAEDSELVTVLYPTGANAYDILYLNQYPELDIYSETALEYFREEGYSPVNRQFRSEIIIELTTEDHTISLFQYKDLLILSFSSIPVDASVMALKEKAYSISAKADISQFSVSSAESATVYLNYEKLNTLSFFMNDGFQAMRKSISDFASLSSLDLQVTDNRIQLSGNTSGSKFLGEEKNNSSGLKIIPANSSFFQMNNFNIQEVKVEEYGYFKNWMTGTFIHFALETFSNNIEANGFLAIKCSDMQMAHEDIEELNLIMNASESYEYEGYEIIHADYSSFINRMFPSQFIELQETELTFIGDYLVLANSKYAVRKLIDLYNENQVMTYSPEYKQFAASLGQYSSSYFYFDPFRAGKFAENMFFPSFPGKLGIQHAKLGEEVYSTLTLETSGEKLFTVDERIWKANLSAKASSLHLVKNHSNNENEILLQDSSSNLYLFSSTGKKLWEREMESPIVGSIAQIDFYDNGKLQYIFTTEKSIHLIDRLGKNVEPYPLKLSARPSTGISVVEYNQRDGMRFFVSGENGNIYGYYRDGKPLPGWNPLKDAGKLKFPLEHIDVNGVDMLLTVSEDGLIRSLNRKGEDRFSPITAGCFISNPLRIKISENEMVARTITSCGLIQFDQEGKWSLENLESIKDSVPMKLASKTDKEIVYVRSKQSLLAQDISGKSLFEISIPWTETDEWQLFEVDGKTYVGISFQRSGEILLIDAEGKKVEDFPMKAKPPFTLTQFENTGEPLFVASDGGGLFAYRLRL